MNNVIFTIPGCARCKIVKDFMHEHATPFEEKNVREGGKEDFQHFYTANRRAIYRGQDGIEFPVFTDGVVIRQGLGPVLAYLYGGKRLDGFVSVGTLHKEWVDGLHVSGGNIEDADDFIAMLHYLKSKAMKLKLDTNGKNSHLLNRILDEGLADFVVMDVLGPRRLYSHILGENIALADLERTISIVPRFPEYRFQTTIVRVRREGDLTPAFLTPEDIAETAELIEEITGSKKHPYFIRFLPSTLEPGKSQDADSILPNAIFSYRTAARAHQVLTEIEKI